MNQTKVGLDLGEAVFAPPNNTYKFSEVPQLVVQVTRGRTHDGVGRYTRDLIQESKQPPVDVARVLRGTRTDVVVSYLPVGSELATQWYVEQALEARCGFINCVPVFIASNPKWRNKFLKRNLPIIGDDVKSQLGATITHRMLAHLFQQRGVRLDRTYQLNFGGNTDFMNMLERERLQSKKISKTQAVTSQLHHSLTDAKQFAEFTPDLGVCQWFHFEDYRLDEAVTWMRRLGVTYIRTGLSWAESLLPGAMQWFDRLMRALDEFNVTVTFCFTPEQRGIAPHHTSPPRNVDEYADFCAQMTRRYAGG